MTDKKRYYLTLNVETAETAQKTAESLGLTLSQYVNLTLNALNQRSAEEAFTTFFTALSETSKKGS